MRHDGARARFYDMRASPSSVMKGYANGCVRKNCAGDRSWNRRGACGVDRARQGRLQHRAGGPPQGNARQGRRRGQRRRRAGAGRSDGRVQTRVDPRFVCHREIEFRPAGCPVQQCRDRCAGGPARGSAL